MPIALSSGLGRSFLIILFLFPGMAWAGSAWLPITHVNVGTDTVVVPLAVENVNSMDNGQFLLLYSGNYIAEVVAVERTPLTQTPHFFLQVNTTLPDSLRVSFVHQPPLTIPFGNLLEIVFRLQPNLPAGTTIPLNFADFGLYDSNGVLVASATNGSIVISGVIHGDFNHDFQLNVMDLLRLIEVVYGINGSFTEEELWHSDQNDDNAINLIDVQIMINQILD